MCSNLHLFQHPKNTPVVIWHIPAGRVGLHHGGPDLVRDPLHAGHDHGAGLPGPLLLSGRLLLPPHLWQCGQNRIRTCSLVENLELTMEKELKFETRAACCWFNQWHSWVHPGYYFAKQVIPGTGQEKKNTCSDLVRRYRVSILS